MVDNDRIIKPAPIWYFWTIFAGLVSVTEEDQGQW